MQAQARPRPWSPAIFLIGCIGARLALAWSATVAPPPLLRLLAGVCALIAAGFASIYLFGLRTHGIETGGGPIWWNALRPFHAATYAVAAGAAWTGRRQLAGGVLLLDALVGLASFMLHHRRR